MFSRISKLIATSALTMGLFLAHPVVAETRTDRRQAVFTAMLSDPTNTALMVEYAQLSIELRDFEAAASTLERMLDIDPANQQARLTLAQAYFALGADQLARYHLDLVTERGALTEGEQEVASSYTDSLDRRSKDIQVTGHAQVGLAYRTDQGNGGLAYSADVNVRQDLGGADPVLWLTGLRLRGYYLPEDRDESKARLVLRTGPSFSIAKEAFGPRLRPYLLLENIRDEDLSDEGTIVAGGIGYDHPVSSQISLFANAEAGRLFREDDDDDADVQRAILGLTWRPVSALYVRVSGRWTTEDGGTDDMDRTGARLDLGYRFNPGTGPVRRDWLLKAYVQGDTEDYDSGREDDLLAYGASLKGYVTNETYAELAVRRFERDSSRNFLDDDETLITLSIGRSF